MKVEPVACLLDNYAYLLIDDAGAGLDAVVVDPSDGRAVLRRIHELGLRLIGALCTHHHADHVGGIPQLLARDPRLQVIAHCSARTQVPGVSDVVDDRELVTIGSMTILALHCPGHTMDAVTWVVDGNAFTGDTLFVAGCGKLFEGTAEMMYRSLNEVIGGLDDTTRIYCGHEYTAANLRFTLQVEPNNAAVQKKLENVLVRRFNGQPTVPSTLAEERETNPYLRCLVPSVLVNAKREGLDKLDPVSVFAWIRERKDRWRSSEIGPAR